MNSAEVIAALRSRFAPPEWYLMTEVANGTGYSGKDRSTYADAVAVNAYQSGKYGAEIHGFEVKVSRADWVGELSDLGKSNAVRRYCDRWWVVVPYPHDRIVRASELPPGWGLLEVSLDAVKTIECATQVDTEPPPRSFLASLVRRASEERAAKEADKGAILKAPLRQVVNADVSAGRLGLACGHTATFPAYSRRPKSVRCLSCADGLPTDSATVETSLLAMSPDELRALAKKAEERAGMLDRNPWMRAA